MLPLGTGLVYAAELQPLLRDAGDLVSVVEVEPQTLWRRKQAVGARIGVDAACMARILELPQRRLVHGIGMPVGGAVPAEVEERQRFAQCLEDLQPVWCSEHLSFNRTRSSAATGSRMTGFLLPPRQCRESVSVAASNIASFSALTQRPVAFETGVNYLRPVAGEISDGEFFASVAEAADCGILLDLHNLWANERNGRQSCREVVSCLPLERVWEIHVAGGNELGGYWLDAHSALVPDEVLALLEELLQSLPCVGAVILEILPMHVPRIGLDAIGRQLEVLRGMWDRRRASARVELAPLVISPGPVDDELSRLRVVRQWEEELVAAIDGASASDPGIALYRRLIADFRAGAVAQCLRCTLTLLFLTIGADRTEELMRLYLGSSEPRFFPEEEALGFADFIGWQDLEVPFLADVLRFESTVLRVAQTGERATVSFAYDPEVLMGCLMEGRLPEIPTLRPAITP